MIDPKWDWADSFIGAVMGAIVGFLSLLGWVNTRLQTVHNRISQTRDQLNEHAVELATLAAHHEVNQKFQMRVDESLSELRAQSSEQLRILAELRGAMNHTSRQRQEPYGGNDGG